MIRPSPKTSWRDWAEPADGLQEEFLYGGPRTWSFNRPALFTSSVATACTQDCCRPLSLTAKGEPLPSRPASGPGAWEPAQLATVCFAFFRGGTQRLARHNQLLKPVQSCQTKKAIRSRSFEHLVIARPSPLTCNPLGRGSSLPPDFSLRGPVDFSPNPRNRSSAMIFGR